MTMFLPPKDKKNNPPVIGVLGRPEDFPIPSVKNLLFYIQRNQNTNTVVYSANIDKDGHIDLHNPIKVTWHQYADKIFSIRPINYLQKKLAYGYKHEVISETLIKFYIVAYPEKTWYLIKKDDGEIQVIGNINGLKSILTNVFVFADEHGAFPLVAFFELYGYEVDSGLPCYEKIFLD